MKRALGLAVILACAAHAVTTAQQAGSNVNVLPVFVETVAVDPEEAKREALVRGDLFLQRQVEPSIAVSTRNPDHLLAAFNDYRAVDFVPDDIGLGERSASAGGPGGLFARLFGWLAPRFGRPAPSGLPEGAAVAEAWIGLSQSATAGVRWSGWLLPGSPVDTSAVSLLSPVHGLEAATDPVLAAAPCGRFYLAFVAFTRGGRSVMAVSRFEDLNNREDGAGAIVYLDTTVIERSSASATGIFHDKPDVIVDPARPASSGDPCAHNVYVSYTTFTGPEVTPPGQPGKLLFRSQVTLARSSDSGERWDTRKLNQPFTHNQGTVLAVDPRPGTPTTTGGGTLYLVWRSFDPTTFLMAKSTDFGRRFTTPTAITGNTPVYPYDQPTTGLDGPLGEAGLAFRTTAFPTATVAADGHLFVGWQERVNVSNCGALPAPQCGQPDPNGSPRIVVTMSQDGGATWLDSAAVLPATPPGRGGGQSRGGGRGQGQPGAITTGIPVRRAVDFADRDINVPPERIGLGFLPEPRASGPQVMPRLSFGGGRLLLAYYEARGVLGPSGRIDGLDRLMDVRAALLDPESGALLQPGSTSQVSQYPLKPFLELEALQQQGGEVVDDVAAVNPPCSPDFGPGFPQCVRQVNRVNTPHSGSGTAPFIGDYIDLEPSVQFVPDEATGGWRWATAAADVPFVGHRSDARPAADILASTSGFACGGRGCDDCNRRFSEPAPSAPGQLD